MKPPPSRRLKELDGYHLLQSNGGEADVRFLATLIPLMSICPE